MSDFRCGPSNTCLDFPDPIFQDKADPLLKGDAVKGLQIFVDTQLHGSLLIFKKFETCLSLPLLNRISIVTDAVRIDPVNQSPLLYSP